MGSGEVFILVVDTLLAERAMMMTSYNEDLGLASRDDASLAAFSTALVSFRLTRLPALPQSVDIAIPGMLLYGGYSLTEETSGQLGLLAVYITVYFVLAPIQLAATTS